MGRVHFARRGSKLVVLGIGLGAALASCGRSSDDPLFRAGAGAAGAGAVGGAGGAGASAAGAGGKPAAPEPKAGTGGSSGAAAATCEGALPYAPGIEYCDSGYVHRVRAEACPLPERRSEAGSDGGAGGEGGATASAPPVCEVDTDCTVRPNGYCVRPPPPRPSQLNPGAPPLPAPVCIYACSVDTDCDAGSLCACDPGYYGSVIDGEPLALGTCVVGACVTDGDCARGLLCVAPVSDVCRARAKATNFHCQRPEDECSAPADCELGFACFPGPEHDECGRIACD